MSKLDLPDHVHQVNENWYNNEKTKKFIHKDNIDKFLEKYWEYRTSTTKAYSQKINEKIAKKRWNNER